MQQLLGNEVWMNLQNKLIHHIRGYFKAKRRNCMHCFNCLLHRLSNMDSAFLFLRVIRTFWDGKIVCLFVFFNTVVLGRFEVLCYRFVSSGWSSDLRTSSIVNRCCMQQLVASSCLLLTWAVTSNNFFRTTFRVMAFRNSR